MTTNLLCFLRRSSYCLFFLLVCSFAYADHAPLPLELRPHHVQQTDSDAIRRREEQIEQIRQSAQQLLQNANRERVANENRRAFRLVFYVVASLVMLAQAWIKKRYFADQEDFAAEKLPQTPAKEDLPIADVADLGMRSKMILRMLLWVVVLVIGVALLVICIKELLTCLNLWQPMIEQGFDPKSLLMKDLIWNGLGMTIGVVLVLLSIWYVFKIRTLFRRVSVGSDDDEADENDYEEFEWSDEAEFEESDDK